MDSNFIGESDLVSFVHLGGAKVARVTGPEPAGSGVTAQSELRNSLNLAPLKVHNVS